MRIYRSIGGQATSEDRHVSGYALRFETPSSLLGGQFIEIIHRGAITQELVDSCDVICYFNHETDKVLARSNKGKGSLTLTLDDEGLRYDFDAPNTSLGDELLEYLKRGDLSQSSFGFTLDPDDESCQKWTRNADGTYTREIFKINSIFDVSPVFQPAYEATSCANKRNKSMLNLKSTLEDLLEYIRSNEENPEVTEETRACDNQTKEETQEEETTKPAEETREEEETTEPTESAEEETTEPAEEEEETTAPAETKSNRNKQTNLTMEKKFSLLKAIRSIANNQKLDDVSAAVIAEGTKEMRNAGLSYGGQIQLPVNELRATITVASEGTDVVATDLYDILEPLRAKNVLASAGAKFITGLVGNVQIPIMSAGNVTWEGETATPASDGAGAFTNVQLTPHRLTAYVDISKQFLAQDGLGAEAMIRQDIVNAINSKLEETILQDDNTNANAPVGMAYNVTPTSITAFSSITALESGVENANVFGECKYIVSPTAKATLRTLNYGGKSTRMVMENGEIDGTPALVTTNVESTTANVIYGDWSQLAIGQWGSVDLTVDPYTKAAAGQVRLVINAFFDAKVLRSSAFAYGKI